MKDFDVRMGGYARVVEGELTRCLENRGELGYRTLPDAMAYSVLGGGKRVRGVVLLAFYALFAVDDKALPFAAAMELVHAYSLVHDDLPCMDNDDLRRGKPSCHIAYGETTALLAGDALLTLAFEIAASAQLPLERVLEATRLLAHSAGMHGMIAGQVLDLAGEGRALTAEELDGINDRKTGALFQAAAGMGCILGGASPEQCRAAEEYAACVGRAFQIMDDVLDITADPKKLGKPVGSDARQEKNTYAVLLGVDGCRSKVAELNARAKAALESMPGDTVFLAELADHLGGRDF